MKLILLLTIITNLAFAQYSITFKGVELGTIKTLDTIKDNYLEATVTNKIARFLLGKDKFIFYNEDYTGSKKIENTKYKKDKYAVIYILKRAAKNNTKSERIEIKKEKYIDVSFEENYKFKYNSKGRIKSDGYFEMKNGELSILEENVNSIKIIKI